MTDPVTNVEIEDVLSSIRRLVSENTRAERTPEAAEEKQNQSAISVEATPDETEAREAQMLVLTPALRVSDTGADTDVAVETEASPDVSDLGEDTPEQSVAEATIQDADHGAVENSAEEESLEVPLEEMSGNLSFIHSDKVAIPPEMATLEDRIAGLEAAVAQREDDWEPDGIGNEENAGAPVESLNWEDSDVADSRWDADDAVEEAELISDQVAAPIDLADFATVSAKRPLKSVETAAEPLPESVTEPMSESELQTAKDVPASAARNGDDPQSQQDQDPEADFLGSEDAVLDEEMLRDMVSEIVRQELQGSLGERITRNVRKLVRREIHRALAARELE